MPVFHCSSVISNTSSTATAPAMWTKASMRPKRSSVFLTTTSAAVGAIKSSSSTSVSAPVALTCWPTSANFSPLRAARTMAPKSRGRRSAVAFPIPELAPVTIATEFDMRFFPRGSNPPVAAFKRLPSAARHGADCVAYNVDDSRWSGHDGRMIDSMRLYRRLHALRHVALRLRDDHSIVFGDQKPARNVLPKWVPDRNSDAAQRYRPLHRSEHGSLVRGRVLRERRFEGSIG